MYTFSLFAHLYANPWITAVVVALLVFILHLPYETSVLRDRRGRRYSVFQSAVYRYERGPGYSRFEYDGLRRVQFWLLLLLSLAATQVQPALVARLAEVLWHLFGR